MPRRKSPEPELTPLELEIMNVLWETGPANVQTVQARHQGPRACLHHRADHAQRAAPQRQSQTPVERPRLPYRPVLSRQKAVTQAVGDMLDRFFGGSADNLVLNLVETRHLTPEKLAQIQKLLEHSRGRRKMETISRSLLTFLLNSLWQIPAGRRRRGAGLPLHAPRPRQPTGMRSGWRRWPRRSCCRWPASAAVQTPARRNSPPRLADA